MRVIKSFIIAFSTYSKVPMPQFAWKEEDMQYIFCFFPWVGALIGVCIYFWNLLCGVCGIGSLCRTAGDLAIPLLITGGMHADGFMDTMDAVHSYGSREKKREILKDPHIGAFSVIMLVLYGLIVFGVYAEIEQGAPLKTVCCGFFLSRCLCGISAVSFPAAKKEGMLFTFTDSAAKRVVKGVLYLQSVVCIGYMFYLSVPAGGILTVSALLTLVYYFYRSRKEFGGVSGDTAGYFVLICEGCMAVAAAIAGKFY